MEERLEEKQGQVRRAVPTGLEQQQQGGKLSVNCRVADRAKGSVTADG